MDCPFKASCATFYTNRSLYFFHLKTEHPSLMNSIITCPLCPTSLKNFESFKKHLARHHSTAWQDDSITARQTVGILCPIQECNTSWRCSTELKVHVNERHSSVENVFICKLCNHGQSSVSLEGLMKHLNRVHFQRSDPCQKHGHCKLLYTVSDGIQEPSNYNEDCLDEGASVVLHQSEDMDIHSGIVDHPEVGEQGTSGTNQSQQTFVSHQGIIDCVTHLYLKAYGKHLVPKTAVDDLMNCFGDIFGSVHSSLLSSLPTVDPATFPLSQRHLFDRDLFPDVMRNVTTRVRARCAGMGFVEPQRIMLSPTHHFHYISVLKTLQNILSDIDIHRHILEMEHSGFSGCYRNLMHSEYFSRHDYFEGDSSFLMIHLYLDELETTNPLGQSRGKFKLLCIYFTLGNIDPMFNSLLKNIHPVAYVKAKDVKQFGLAEILRPLVQEMKLLSTIGIEMVCTFRDGSCDTITFKGNIVIVSGDNLGQHQCGGFSESFSRGYVCRFCDILFDDLRSKKCEADVNLLINNVGYKEQLLPSECILEELAGFSRLTSLPPDLQHDFISGKGGIINSCLKSIFIFLKTIQNMSLEEISNRISTFSYGCSDTTSKPRCLVSESYTFSLKSAQALCLFYLLPFIFGDKIDRCHISWKLYYLLSDIVSTVFAMEVDDGWLNDLKVSINKFYKCIVEDDSTFTDFYIRPKLHYLLHYPRLLRYYGNLRSLWCMRFESYHTVAKAVIQANNNFKNITYSVAHRVQYRKCYERAENPGLGMKPVFGKLTPVRIDLLDEDVKRALQLHDSVSAAHKTSNAKIDGVQYHKNNVYLLKVDPEKPHFAKLDHILVLPSNVYCVGKEITTLRFNATFSAYEVQCQEYCVVWDHPAPVFHPPMNIYSAGDQQFVKLRFRVPKL